MNPHSAAETYRRQSIENAPPVKVVQLLYAGALRFLDQALASEPRDPAFTAGLSRADEIVVELRLALDPSAAPELASSLCQLYLYVEERLAEASIERQHAPARVARDILARLQQGWLGLELDDAAGDPR
jgi:flagellar protein FliS